MLGSQYGPENERGPTRNWYLAGTRSVDASTLHAAAHAAWNACVHNSIIFFVKFSKDHTKKI